MEDLFDFVEGGFLLFFSLREFVSILMLLAAGLRVTRFGLDELDWPLLFLTSNW